MNAWVLDDGPFGLLADVLTPEAAAHWPKDSFYLARQTEKDATERRRELLDAVDTPFTVFDMGMEGESARILYLHLRRPSGGTANLAEHQTIAWGLTERIDVVFVTEDRAAAFLALVELGSCRVVHSFEFWSLLEQAGLITEEQMRVLFDKTWSKGRQSLPKAPWRYVAAAGLTPAG